MFVTHPFSHILFTVNFILKWRVGQANTSVPVTYFPVLTYIIRLSICSYHSGRLYVCIKNLFPFSEVKVKLPVSASVVPLIVNLGTRWGWTLSFTARPLYPQKIRPGTNLVGCLVVLRASLDAFGEYRRNFLLPSVTESPFVGCPGRSLINIPTILSRLPSMLLVEVQERCYSGVWKVKVTL